MFAFSKKRGIFIAIIIALIIWISLNFILIKHQEASNNSLNQNFIQEKNTEIKDNNDNKMEKSISEIKGKVINPELQGNWKIYIPKIDVTMNVTEGDYLSWMTGGFRHDESTDKWNKNVVMISIEYDTHNLYDILKCIEIGDIIQYELDGKKREYKVTIKEDDIVNSYTQNTEDDKLTILTLTEEEPESSLCIQATPIN